MNITKYLITVCTREAIHARTSVIITSSWIYNLPNNYTNKCRIVFIKFKIIYKIPKVLKQLPLFLHGSLSQVTSFNRSHVSPS